MPVHNNSRELFFLLVKLVVRLSLLLTINLFIMNKKVLTLCAGFMLAGGVSVFAQASTPEVKMLSLAQAAADANQYYIVNVNSQGVANSGCNDLDFDSNEGHTADNVAKDATVFWRVEKVSQIINGTERVNGYRLINKESGKALVATVDGKTYDVLSTATDTQSNGKMILFYQIGGKKYYVTGTAKNGVANVTEGESGKSSAWGYGMEAAPANVMDGKELSDILALNGKFAVQIGGHKDLNNDGTVKANEWAAYTTFEGGNVFDGDLYVAEDAKETGYALYKDAAHTKQIVLTTDKWQQTSSELSEGYIFKVMDAAKVKDAKNILTTEFLITAPSTVKGEPIEIVALEKKDGSTVRHEVVVSIVKNAAGNDVNRLTVAQDNKESEAEYMADLTQSVPFATNTYIKFGAGNIADPAKVLTKNTFYTITEMGADANLLFVAGACGTTADKKVTFAEAVDNELEAQWAISYDTAKEVYTITNREDKDITFELGKNGVREDSNTNDNIYLVNGQSYKIDAVETTEKDGYKWLGDVKNQHYAIAHWSNVYDNSAWITVDKNGNAILKAGDVKDVAAELQVVDARVDTVYVEHTFNYFNNGWKEAKHTLKVPVYSFADLEGNDFAVVSGTYSFNAKKAQPLAIRENGDKWNLRTAKFDTNLTDKNNDAALNNYLVDAGDSKEGLLENKKCIYDTNDGQTFIVENLNRPIYRRLGATVEDGLKDMDVNNLKFYRTNDENTYLYENSANRNANNGEAILNFLGETNLADQPEGSALAIFVDTAYVRNNTMEPLYLLSVRNTFVEGKDAEPCNATDHQHMTADGKPTNDPYQCFHAKKATPDYREGAYLVGLADSTDIKQVKYQGNVRLAFVDAKHIGDSLIINSSKFTATKDAANDTLSFVNKAGEQVENAATFSFRLVDPADSKGDFYIETVAKEGKNQYVRVHNSVPVLVSNLDQAATFNVNETEEQATSNENIAAGSVVVAGVDGAIVVKGAEGKNVIVSTILGKVVANEVLTSDNAQIAAPAGIVVVSVDGESFKVVVK